MFKERKQHTNINVTLVFVHSRLSHVLVLKSGSREFDFIDPAKGP
jgi:hypothetical protein